MSELLSLESVFLNVETSRLYMCSCRVCPSFGFCCYLVLVLDFGYPVLFVFFVISVKNFKIGIKFNILPKKKTLEVWNVEYS